VREQIAEVRRRGLRGYQAYTIGHATDAEWPVLVQEAEMDAIEELKKVEAVAAIFLQASSHALRGEKLPPLLERQIRWLLR
jgi:hypothetical protein